MGARKIQTSFTAGELSPSMYGRPDDSEYAKGLAVCENFIPLPQGPVTLRPGTAFVNYAKAGTGSIRLIPFTFSVDQTMVLEFGDYYVRFHTEGQTLLDEDGSIYEVESPFSADEVYDIHYVQSMDVMTLVHPDHAPVELRRYGANDWRFEQIDFSAQIEPPTITSVTYSVVVSDGVTVTDSEKTRYTLRYKVTSLMDTDTGTEESEASEEMSCQGNLYLDNATVTISWSAVADADRYRIYKSYQGLFCYIGETDELSFIDDNYEPDASVTPPIYDDPFGTLGGISAVTVENGGSGYSYGQVADFSISDLTSDKVSSINGYGSLFESPSSMEEYTVSWPHVMVPYEAQYVSGTTEYVVEVVDNGGTGSGATVSYTTQTVESGFTSTSGDSYTYIGLKSVTLTSPGENYTNPVLRVEITYNHRYGGTYTAGGYFSLDCLDGDLAIEVEDSTGSGASLVPVVQDGSIVSVTIQSAGAGYTSPTLTVTASQGSGAELTATVTPSDFPNAVCYHEQRRCFGGTTSRPHMVWMTRTGTESNMSYTLPTQDDNRVKFRIIAQDASRVEHMVPLSSLIAFTDSAEYAISAMGSGAIAPDSIDVERQAQVGASSVQPLLVGTAVLYAANRGGHLRELGYTWQASGYTTGDVSLRADHLFENGKRVIDLALMKTPDSIVWAPANDGTLYAFTYLPDQSIGAWSRHIFQGGSVIAATVVSEGDEDALYLVVERTINGETVRCVERMKERAFTELENCWHVDCGGEYEGEETTTVSGIYWLEGQEVAILADGCVLPHQVVTDGKITLDIPASHVIVGIPITGTLRTMPFVLQANDGSYGLGHTKNINKIWIRVRNSSGITAGASLDSMMSVKQRTTEAYGLPPSVLSDEASLVLMPQWTKDGQFYIQQTDPLPLTVVNITYDLAQ